MDEIAHAVTRADAVTELAGHYTIASLGADDGFAMADPFAFETLYTATDGPLTVVGNRSRAVAEVMAAHRGTPARRDPELAAFVAWAGIPIGTRTGFCDVAFVPQGQVMHFPAHRARVEAPARHYLAAVPGSEPTLREATEEMVAAVRFAIDSTPVPPVLDLTGGKDTRLLLAVTMQAGLLPDVRVITRGLIENDDTRVAAEIVDRFDLTTTLPPLEPRALGLVDRIRAHAERTDGLSSAFDTSHASPDRRLAIASHAGEIMRGDAIADDDPRDLDEALAQFAWNPFGRGDFVVPDLARQFEQEDRDRFLAGLDFTDDVSELHELYEACNRNRWISSRPLAGPPRVYAAIPHVGVRYAWSRGRAFRSTEPVHVPLISAASRDLLDHRLTKGHWNTRPVPRIAAAKPSAPAPAGGELFTHRGDDWGSAVTEILDENPDSPAFDVIDQERVRAAATGFARLGLNERRQLLGAATAVVWMNETEGLSRAEWPA
ncbi:MAG: hypothetical protein DHS20C19_09220 [Acidimicrobiales bacterium]|nr:MAG: hypothetical protein DHS20C19_09220 [Acidimicrobiales bacterium]